MTKQKIDMEKIHKESKSKVITIILVISLFCVLSLLLLIIFEDRLFFGQNNSKNASITNLSYDEIAGVYIKSGSTLPDSGTVDENGDEVYDYVKLTINKDGTAKYESLGTKRSGEIAQGPFVVGKGIFYVVNSKCQDMVILGEECVYPNCSHVIELTYKDGKFITDSNEELIKQ